MAKITRTAVVDNDAFDTDEQGYEEESYEAPTRPAAKPNTTIQSGWGETEVAERRETVKAPYLDFKNGDSIKIVKLLDDAPFARWYRHFVPGKPPIYCHGRENCPICAKNWKAQQNWRMNVIEMSDAKSATPDGWTVKVWDFSWPVVQQLQAYAAKIPLNAGPRYFQLMHIPNKGITVVPLNTMSLEDEHGLFPLSDGEFEEAQTRCYGEESIFINSPKQVADIAAGLSVYVPKD